MNADDVLYILTNFFEWLKQKGKGSGFSVQERKPFQATINRAEDPTMYRSMIVEQGHALALVALALFDVLSERPGERDQYLPHCILLNLANGVPGSLVGLYSELLKRDLSFGETSFFREADSTTRNTLITFIEEGGNSVYTLPELLCALAWIDDEVVQHQFQRWREDSPAWSASLYKRDPAWFTLYAGWELTFEGRRRNLYFQESYDIVPLDQTEITERSLPSPLMVASALQEERCGWCDRPLMTLFEIDVRDPRVAFLGLQGERLRIPICLNCSFQYGYQNKHVFMDVDWFGKASWSSLNGEPPDDLQVYQEGTISYIDFFPPPLFVLGASRCTSYECTGSHFGGCPDWPQQDPDYPRCPACQHTMLFLAQHDLDHVNISGFEGYIYAFLCITCQKATIVQQH